MGKTDRIWPFGVLALILAAATTAFAEDDFPIVGTYLQNERCKGDGTDRAELRVIITRRDINSNMGLCEILDKKRDGNTIAVHLGCNSGGSNLILGDVTFKIRPDQTLEFTDQDNVYNAILHKCP